MSDLLDRQHVDAALDLLRGDTGLTVYPDPEGNTPEPVAAERYVRVYSWIEAPADAPGNNMGGTTDAWTVYWRCHCVGPNEYSSIAVAMRVRAALLDKRPTSITGRKCGLIRHAGSNPPNRDESAGSPIFTTVVDYKMTTQPG